MAVSPHSKNCKLWKFVSAWRINFAYYTPRPVCALIKLIRSCLSVFIYRLIRTQAPYRELIRKNSESMSFTKSVTKIRELVVLIHLWPSYNQNIANVYTIIFQLFFVAQEIVPQNVMRYLNASIHLKDIFKCITNAITLRNETKY